LCAKFWKVPIIPDRDLWVEMGFTIIESRASHTQLCQETTSILTS
jgi:hypothetical protein